MLYKQAVSNVEGGRVIDRYTDFVHRRHLQRCCFVGFKNVGCLDGGCMPEIAVSYVSLHLVAAIKAR